MRGLLRSWPLQQQRAFFETDLGLPLALEAESGKLFPVSNRARDVRDALVRHARLAGVQFDFNTALTRLERQGEGWAIHTNRGALSATRVILATGGLSVPSTGSDGVGLRAAESHGHRVHPPYPALTPLLAEPAVHASLSGISLDVRLRSRVGKKAFETVGGFLFTHRGYSGPSILDLSHLFVRDRSTVIRVQWTSSDADEWDRLLASSTANVANVVSSRLAQRLTAQLMNEARVPLDRKGTELRRAERTVLIDGLTTYPLPITGDEGFKKAEVTGGGVALDELNPRTLESRRHRGLFLCGEMLDAFGPIGGHNFAWAWATGRLAGLGAAQSLLD
jgi:hypothetical protein